ncbi:MAG: DUF4411 family protein [Armatimonadetes bacterium]|nr:DUF4411 family protein [Armatimonadota bacterium]
MYLVDANVFIDAKNRYYPFDVVPGFWDWLLVAHGEGKLCTVEAVHNELVGAGDELSTWITSGPRSFTLPTSDIPRQSLQVVSLWALQSPQYTQAAITDFLSVADYFLVAQAHAINATVVTNERAGTGSKNRIKIPDACDAVAVSWMSPFEMLRTENATFRL